MMAEDYQYFILIRSEVSYSTLKPGRIGYIPSKKYKAAGSKRSLNVLFVGSFSALDYPVEVDSLQPITREEAALLMAVPEEDRLTALKQPQSLRLARRLKEGTEVWVREGSALLKGTIRFIGNIKEPIRPSDLEGVFYGVELQGSDRGRGSTNGSNRYKQFFFCDENCGVFAPFNRITAVGPQTSPDPQPGQCPKSSPDPQPGVSSKTSPGPQPGLSFKSSTEPQARESRDLKLRMKLSKPESRPDSNQPMSFLSNHFQKDPPKRESSPESKSESCLDSGPKSLSTDPEAMIQDHVYEDPDLHRDPSKGVSKIRSKSAKLGHVSDKFRIDGKDKPRFRVDLRPGSAKKATPFVPESRPETRPESEDHVKSLTGAKTRLANLRTPRLRLKSQSDTESRSRAKPRPESPEEPKSVHRGGSTDGLQTGDQVLFIDEKEQTVKGTYLFKEETEEGTMVHMRGESGTSFFVPLVGLMKLEHETEDMYSDPGPESSPESRPDGPKARLSCGSTDGLTAGDQVMFLGEKEQVLEGTVVFMEDTDEGTVVHITGDSGTSTVPLRCVTKMDPKTIPTEDLDSVVPPVEHQENCSSLGLDSVVEIDLSNGVKGFGTIRWVGFLPGVRHKMAGLELEEQRGVSDGTFRGQRFFWCPDKHALFVKISSCRPDSRFCKASANHSAPHTGQSTNHNGFPAHQNVDDTSESDLEPVPPIAAEEVERLLIGRMKGIQGHHNSCYMDSALFSLFSVSSVLDSLLFKSTSPGDRDVQRILLRDIVNPLRRDGFVEGRHVMNLRRQLQKHGFSQSFTTDEKDPEEFLTVIMQHILNLDPLLKLCSGGKVQDSFCFQIFLDQNHDLVLPTVQQLLEHSFHSNALKLSEVPSCLILQMPRFGKKFKMFEKILPSVELDITDLLQQGPKQCVLCGAVALWECSDCFLDPVFSSNGLKVFCEQCSAQVHAHSRRHGHHPAHLDTLHGRLSERFHGNRDKLHLLAVLCIETSHYVSFVKYGPEPQHWLFFDSMADREGEADGFNVPKVSLAPELSQYLNMSLSELANQVPRDMRGVAKRLLCDAYLYLYQSPALHLYT